MSKLYRVLLFFVAMYMYYLFIIDTEEPITAVGKIILVAALLIAMELIRKGSSKVFDAHSKIEEIDEMDEDKFIKYIAELYRRQEYQVYTLEKDKKRGCDLKAYKVKDSICIKCVHLANTETADVDVISEAYSSIKQYNVKRCIVITNANYTEEASSLAKINHVKLIGRNELSKLIYKVINKQEINDDIANPQEA